VGKRNPTFEELIRLRVVFTVRGMDAVSAQRNVPYKTADDQSLHMDVYSPPGPRRARPAIVFIHGGPIPRIGAKNMGVFLSYGELAAASGFVAVTFDHRFLAPARLPDAAADVADLITHVRTNAEALGVDADRLALWAFSGGGPFLAGPLRERPSWLRAVIGYYAALDLQQPASDAEPTLTPEVRVAHSPAASLADAHSAPPILIARAGLDNAGLNATIDRFVQAALSGGATLDLLNHSDGRHGFDILDDDERSKQIIRHTLQFLADNLAGPHDAKKSAASRY